MVWRETFANGAAEIRIVKLKWNALRNCGILDSLHDPTLIFSQGAETQQILQANMKNVLRNSVVGTGFTL